jgi:hypothetical protein
MVFRRQNPNPFQNVSGTKYLETGSTNREDFEEKFKREHIEGIFIVQFNTCFHILGVKIATDVHYRVKIKLPLCLKINIRRRSGCREIKPISTFLHV